ncbi:Oligosaccharyl transferase STT3 subunit [anaerobic digester metagenome]
MNVPLIVTCFWLPAFIGPISGVIAYLFVRRFTNEYGGLAAGIIAVTVPLYVVRTVPGWFDTDMFNVLFPLLIMWFICEAVQKVNPKNSTLFAILAAFSTALFSMAWNGWSYVFYIVSASFLVYIMIFKLISWRRSKDFHLKTPFKVFLIYVSLTIIFLLLLGTLKTLIAPLSFLQFGVQSTWPNINVSVSELAKPTFIDIILDMGIAFFLGIFGFLLMLMILINKKLNKKNLRRINWFFYFLLVSWALIGFGAAIKGVRFIILLIPPFVVSSGVMFGIFIEYLMKFRDNGHFKDNGKKYVISLILLVLIVIPSVLGNYTNFSILNPDINDDMADAATWLNQNTPNDTVIFSYWSYGHFFTVSADRPFSVDGGSMNTPRTYFINKAFTTDNETLANGIFRMIATNGDKGYVTLDSYTKNSTETAEILNNILGVDEGSAVKILREDYGLGSNQAQNVVKFTHPAHSRPFIILTYGKMVEKGYWVFYFGNWNFNKLEGYKSDYYYGDITDFKNHFINSEGLINNSKSNNLMFHNETLYSIITVKNGVVKKQYLNENSDICVIIQFDSKKYVVLNKQFENSTFTKMVIERSNTTYFNIVYENSDVYMWKPKTL